MSQLKNRELQSAGEVLSEMGFDKSSKQSTKAAFIRYLFKQAYGVDIEPPQIYQNKAPQQLSFAFDSAEPEKPKAS